MKLRPLFIFLHYFFCDCDESNIIPLLIIKFITKNIIKRDKNHE